MPTPSDLKPANDLRSELKNLTNALAPEKSFKLPVGTAASGARVNRHMRRSRPTIQLGTIQFAQPMPLNQRLKNTLFTLRNQLSAVSMYLDADWIIGLNRQLEFLLDPEEWPEDSSPPTVESFATFLALTLLVRPHKRPSLGVSDYGSLAASWEDGEAMLFIEFHPAEAVRWSAAQPVKGRDEIASGQTTVARLVKHLTAYNPERWFERIG